MKDFDSIMFIVFFLMLCTIGVVVIGAAHDAYLVWYINNWHTHSDRPPSEIVRTRTLWITLCINTLDKSPFVCYLILNDMRNLPPLPEATWEITFDNDSTVFIAGRDEAHARRIVENNKGFSRWRRTPECEWQIRTIKKIERVTW